MELSKEFSYLKKIFILIVSGLIVFFAIGYYLVISRGALIIFSPVQLQNLESIIILLSLIGIPAGHYYHKKRISHLSQELSGSELLKSYKVSFIVKLAILEGMALITLVGYMLSGNQTFLLIYAIFFLIVLINYPGESKLKDELNLNKEEE